MAYTAGDVVAQAHLLLQDDGTRWPETELFLWIDEAQRFVARLVPEALAKRATVTLSAGAEQQLPSDGALFFRVVRDSTGRTPRQAVKRALDVLDPDWPDARATAAVRHYMMDEHRPQRFWVYPPNTGTDVEIEYQAMPVAAVDSSTPLTCHDRFFTAVLDYVMYRAYDKDAEDAANKALSESHFVRAAQALGASPRAAQIVATKERDNG